MKIEDFAHNAIISLLGSLLGILLGLAVGYGLIRIWSKFQSQGERFQKFMLFAPWRTVLVGLLMLNFVPIAPILLVGLGNNAGIISIAYIAFFITIIVVCQSVQGQFVQPISQIASWLRTFAVFSVILTIHYGIWGGGGLGFLAREYFVLMKYKELWILYWGFCGVAFVIDTISAFIQWFMYPFAHRT